MGRRNRAAARSFFADLVSTPRYVLRMEDSGYVGGMAVVHARASAELARLLTLSTADGEGLLSLDEATGTLENVALLLETLPTALDQVGRWLDRQVARGRAEVLHGPYAGHPAEAVSVVLAYMTAVRGMLLEARRGVTSAQLIVASLDEPDATAHKANLTVVY